MVKVKFLKTIGQFKKGQEYEIREALAKYWKRYVEIVPEAKKKKKTKNKAILDTEK